MPPSKLHILLACAMALFLLRCGDDVVGPDAQGPFKGIYALKYGEQSGIYYSSYDPIDFRKIGDNPDIVSLLLLQEQQLLVAASRKKVLFIDTRTRKIVSEITVPNTVNPERNIEYGRVRLFEDKLAKDRCILINRSVYTIDLQNRKIDQVLWDVERQDKLTYIHDVALTEDGEHVLLSLSLLGLWPIDPVFSRYEMRQRLLKLDVRTHDAQLVYDYPREDVPGSKYVLPTDEMILSYDPNRDAVLSFSALSGTLVDSFQVSASEFMGDEYPQGESIIVQSLDQGSFFRLTPHERKVEPVLSLDLDDVELGATVYQQLAGGDLYASVVDVMRERHFLVNLSSGRVALEFESESTYRFIIEEE